MPQGVLLHIPFSSRISPDFDRAHTCHLEWPRSFGLLPTKDAEQRHLQGRYTELAARFHPSATGIDLDLAVDQLSWFFVFDDYFDGPLGQDLTGVKQLTHAVTEVLDDSPQAPRANATPIIAAFADLWTRSQKGMSATWRTRAAQHWRSYLTGYVTEAMNRNRGRAPSLADQLALRNDTIGAQPVLDLAERLGHFEVPEQTYSSPLLTTMRLIATEVVVLDNDIVSVEREEELEDYYGNFVLHIEREMHCSRPQAIEEISAMVHERTEHFLGLERQLPQLYDALGLHEIQRLAVDRYDTDALRALMRGAYDWSQQSGRYKASCTTLATDAHSSVV